MSVLPPAGHGTISVTGFDGKAARARWSRRTAARPADRKQVVSLLPPPPADNINFPAERDLLLDISRSDFVAGVAGAGTMGRGIAQVLAQSGARTLLFDALPVRRRRQGDDRRGARQARRERPLAAGRCRRALGRLEVVDKLERFSQCHVVVEAIIEDLGAKRELFARLESIVGESCVLASNTSSLSVTEMAAALQRPERVAGYHFFNRAGDEDRRSRRRRADRVLGHRRAHRIARRFGHEPIAARTRRASSSITPGAPSSPNRCACFPKASPISPPSTGSSSMRRASASGPLA